MRLGVGSIGNVDVHDDGAGQLAGLAEQLEAARVVEERAELALAADPHAVHVLG